MKLLTKEQIVEVLERFKKANPNPRAELEYVNPFTLLVSVVLSAQATDKSVNIATAPLYKIADNPQAILDLGEEKLVGYIKSIGLWKNKSKNIIALCKKLISDFGGEVPHDREKLMSLPGVGRKTANVVLNVIWGEHTMPVDTHLLRFCPKVGLAQGKNPQEVEMSLLERIPDEYMVQAHHWFLLHGRYVCTARNPKCSECILNDLCCHNEIQ
ncbi:endonuclease III [Treponema pectinovorum]|uniref:endonuclease III n=1 Tax=Treponema pectinovorum TaxID=164 RepID=UPI0011CB80D3|nr:endonuclease III [Treponema pectinovorum]